MLHLLASAASERDWQELIFVCVLIIAFAVACH